MKDDPGPTAADKKARSDLKGMPRWVKVFLIVGAALLIVAVVVFLIGGGQHGPGRHLSSPPLTTTHPSPMLTTASETPGR